MNHFNRRELLQHSAALGLGAAFVPALGGVVAADQHRSTKPPAGVVLETITAGGLSHYSYFLADLQRGQAVVIDPRRDVQVYLDLAQKHGVQITSVVETHVHGDFVSGARQLAAATGTAKIAASIEGDPGYGFAIDRPLRDGDRVTAGRITLTAIHTPGHTPEHMSFVASDGDGPATADTPPWALFTGDFLFVGSVGRPDLMGVANTDRLAAALYRSVQTAFNELPGQLTIYPAHGPGSPCGAGIQSAEGDPTLAQQRNSNPYWQDITQQGFTDALLDAQPPVPTYWPRMKQINAAGPTVLRDAPQAKPLKPKAFAKFIADPNVQVLDTRSMHAFAGGHIRGSINIGYNEVLSLWGGWTLDPNRPIALVKASQGSFEGPLDWLSRVDLTNVAVTLEGDMTGWVKSGQPFDSYPTFSVHEVHEQLSAPPFTLLDVRQPAEWDGGHLPGAQYMFLPEIPDRADELSRDKPIAVYCGNGYRASIAASLLRARGIDARSVPGSWDAWTAAGYPSALPKYPGKASDTRRVA